MPQPRVSRKRYQTAFTDFWNEVQNQIDDWIKAGGLKRRGQGNGRS